MESPLPDQIRECIGYAANAKDMLVFVVGKSGAGKTAFLRSVAHSLGMTYTPLGGELSRRLLNIPARLRPMQMESLADQILLPTNPTGFCIDNTEALFDPHLHCDPIRLAFNLSRSRLIIFSLNGSYQGRRFTHGYPDHPEHVSVDLQGVPVIAITNQQVELHEN